LPRPVAYLIVFVSSCCTLILELVAGRILAPYIGVSLYPWTSIIGVVLAGISLGNSLGGRIADRWPQRRTLGILLVAGGLASLAILPLITIATAIPTGELVDPNNRLGGALPLDRATLLILRIVVITTLIFFPPSFILGMVSPVVIKLTLRDLAHSGGLVGKVYALSTLGSILGTFATGFVLVHSYNSLEDPNFLEYGYIKVYAEIADYLAQRVPNQAIRVLYVGGGGYTLTRHIEATYPNARQEIMEIDPGVTQTVYEQLGVDRVRTNIVTYNVDGRLMVNQLVQHNAGQYDLIIGDAFNDLSIPYHLTTMEFDQSLKRLLKPDGFYLALVIDKLRGGKFMPAYTDTVLQVWPAVQVLSDAGPWQSSAPSTYVVAAGNYPIEPG